MDNKDLALKIVEGLGGKENIQNVYACVTRMRTQVADPSLIKEVSLKSLEGVLGLHKGEDGVHIILGPDKAMEVTNEAISQFGLTLDKQMQDTWQEKKSSIEASHEKAKKLFRK